MGVYTYNVGNLPTVPPEPTATGMGTGLFQCPPGKWTSAQVRHQGIIIPDPNFPVTYVGTVTTQSSFAGGAYDTLGGIATANDQFDSGYYNAAGALAAVNAHQGHVVNVLYLMSFAYQGRLYTAQITSTQLQLTGTPTPWWAPPGINPRQKLGNLFYISPPDPAPSLGGPNTPPVFPQPQWNPPLLTASFQSGPFGIAQGSASGGLNGLDQGGSVDMACLRRKGSKYLLAGPMALPAAYQVDINSSADWLHFVPGLFNNAGSGGNFNLGVRIYRGVSLPAAGSAWVTGYGALGTPEWVGVATLSDLIPWNGPMQFVVEVYGAAATIPAASAFDALVAGFDLS